MIENGVKVLAQAVDQMWRGYKQSGMNARLVCEYCGHTVYEYRNDWSDIEHSDDCPVLLALDVLNSIGDQNVR
jgi:hypothetical protein